MRRPTTFWIIMMLLGQLASTPLLAEDVYLLRFFASGKEMQGWTSDWLDDTLFYNPGTQPAIVRILGISNGPLQPDAPNSLTIPPRTVVSLRSSIGTFLNPPGAGNPARGIVWVLHLDVPAGLVVESRNEFYRVAHFGPPVTNPPVGRVSMPVFRRLASAAEPQVILGTDLGLTKTRINVGIYNAGAIPATAKIEIRRACDDSLTDSRSVTIPPNTTLQIGPMVEGSDVCSPSIPPPPGEPHRPDPWVRYTVVTVDQPSLSYVANVTEEVPGACPPLSGIPSGLTPVVSLAIAQSQKL